MKAGIKLNTNKNYKAGSPLINEIKYHTPFIKECVEKDTTYLYFFF